MPPGVRARFERALGRDLSRIRVHRNPASDSAADRLDARAFTVGRQIHFAAGEYDPWTRSGRNLLAHEVAHVAQGAGADSGGEFRLSSHDDPLEKRAQQAVQQMTRGETVDVGTASARERRLVHRDRRGGRRRVAQPDVAECGSLEPWTPTTLDNARAELGDEPCMTLQGGRIGPWHRPGLKYPLSYQGKSYQIIVNDRRRFFGIRYTGGGRLTTQAVDWLRNSSSPPFFDDTQRHIVDAVVPHVRTEGSLSSINTYDSQLLTLAGRGNWSGRVDNMVDNAERMADHFGAPAGNIAGIRERVAALSVESALGTAGARFSMPDIHALVLLIEQRAAQRMMTLAKLNDAILTYYGRPTSGLYYRDVPAATVREFEEALAQGLDDVIIGVAIHLALGEPAYFRNPRDRAIEANAAYPQREAEVAANQRDYDQLSRQAAYMIKMRVANRLRTRSERLREERRSVGPGYIRALMFQKVTDFNHHFQGLGLPAPEGDSHFRVDAVRSDALIPGWSANRAVTYLTAPPPEGRLHLKVSERRGSRTVLLGYVDFGLPVEGAAPVEAGGAAGTSAADVDVEEGHAGAE